MNNAKWLKDLKRNGPMFCKEGKCPEFRKRDPKFARRLQNAGIIAHYMGKEGSLSRRGDYWYLSGITPIDRSGLERLMKK